MLCTSNICLLLPLIMSECHSLVFYIIFHISTFPSYCHLESYAAVHLILSFFPDSSEVVFFFPFKALKLQAYFEVF